MPPSSKNDCPSCKNADSTEEYLFGELAVAERSAKVWCIAACMAGFLFGSAVIVIVVLVKTV